MVNIRTLAIDEYNFPRTDFIKIDVEGMELEALDGADKTIKNNRPVLLIEKIKSNSGEINAWLKDRGYVLREVGINTLAVHADDKTLPAIIPTAPSP